MSYGFASHIGIAAEADWGTAVGATDYIEAFSESLARAIERFETRNIVGGYFEPDDSAGVRRFAGDLVFAGHPVSIGYVLNGVLGINSVDTVGADMFRNRFTALQQDVSSLNPLPPYTLEMFRAGTLVNTSFQLAGVQFGGVQLNVAPNQDLRVTAATIGKTENNIAKTTPSFPGSPTEAFLFDTCSIQLPGGAAVNRIEALTINYTNNLEGIPTLNAANEIAKVRRTGPPMLGVSGTVDFVDRTDYDNFVSQAEQQMIVSFVKANSFALVLDMPRLVFTEFPINIAGRERLTVDFSMKGRYHTGSAAAIQVDLTTVNTF